MSMKRIFIIYLLLVLTFSQEEENVNVNGTESYFFSVHALGRTPEVSKALENIEGQVKVARTACNVSGITYILDNFTIGIEYNPSKQTSAILTTDLVTISGGRFEFTYKFNFTRKEEGKETTGSAYGIYLLTKVQSYPILYNTIKQPDFVVVSTAGS